MILLRLLYDLINNNMKPLSETEKAEFLVYLKENNIFYRVIQPNIHEQVLFRSVFLLKFMLENEIIGWNEI